MYFYRATAMLSAVLAIEILSVCQSVRPSVKRVLWQNEQTFRQYFNTTWKAILSILGKTKNGWWQTIPSTRNLASKWSTLYFKTHHVAIGCDLRALARQRDCCAVSGATAQLLVIGGYCRPIWLCAIAISADFSSLFIYPISIQAYLHSQRSTTDFSNF